MKWRIWSLQRFYKDFKFSLVVKTIKKLFALVARIIKTLFESSEWKNIKRTISLIYFKQKSSVFLQRFLLFALVARTIKYLFLNLSISNIYDSAFLLPSGPSVSSVCPFNLWPIAKRVQILYPELLVLR